MAGGNPLFEVFVRIRQEGLDEIDKSWKEKEEQLTKAEKAWDDFVNKKFPKQTRKIAKELGKVGEAFKTVTSEQKNVEKAHDAWVKKVKEGSEQSTSAIQKVGEALSKVQEQLDKANQTGLNIKANLEGVDDFKKQIDELLASGGEINLKVNLENGVESLELLRQIQDVRNDLNAQGVEMPVALEGIERALSDGDQLRALRDDLNRTPIAPQVDTSGIDALDVSLGDSRDRAGELSSAIGGDGGGRGDRNSVSSSIRIMDADAKAANALPTLLGDAFHQITQFRTVLAAVAATTIPTLIAGLGGAMTAVTALAAGVGALATGLTVGLVGGGAQVASAMGAAGASIYGVSTAANAAISNVLGLGKGFGSLQAEAKFAEGQVKAFQDLVAAMPAGTDAATAAQERLSQALFYQESVVRSQIYWWNTFGEAAVELGGNFQQLRFDLFEITSELGGKLIPTLNNFVEIALSQIPAVREASDKLAIGFSHGTAELRAWLESARGIEVMSSIFEAIGDAAYPTFKIIGDGLILAAELSAPMIKSGQDILVTLQKNITAAERWAQTAEGQRAIGDAWEYARAKAAELYQAVENLVVTVGNLGRAFIQSGLVDQMMAGFVNATQAVRDFTASAQDADSEFSQFLDHVGPLLTTMGQTLGIIVEEALKVVSAIIKMRDAGDDLTYLQQIIESIGLAAQELGPLLISAFEQLAPVLARLIPELAELARIFLDATPILVGFLNAVELLMSAFNLLPNSVQQAIATITAFSLLFGGPSGLVGSLFSAGSAISTFIFQAKVLAALNVAGPIASWVAGVGSFSSALGAGIGMIGSFISALAPLLAIAAAGILIEVAINYDQEAAQAAYDQAKADGDTTARAWLEAWRAGFEGSYFADATLDWLERNIRQPIEGELANVQQDGTNAAERFSIGFKEGAPHAEAAGKSLVDRLKQALTQASGVTGGIGVQAGSGFNDGFRSTEPEAESAGSDVSAAANRGLESEDGSVVGHAHGAAFADGVVQEASAAEYAGETVSQAAADALEALEEADAAGSGVAEAYAAAIEAGATEAQAAAALGVDETTMEYAKTPGLVGRALEELSPEMVAQFRAAHAEVANTTAEFANTIQTNYEAVQTNVGIMFDNIRTTIEAKGGEWATAATTAADGVKAALESAFTTIGTSTIATAVDGWVTELDRLGTDGAASVSESVDAMITELDRLTEEGEASAQAASDAIIAVLDTLSTEGVVPITTLVDEIIKELERLKTESQRIFEEIKTELVRIAEEIRSEVTTEFEGMTDDSLEAEEELNTESSRIWSDMQSGIINAATAIRTQVVSQFQQMEAQSTTIFNRLATNAVKAMERAKSAMLDNSPVPDLVNGVIGMFDYMREETVEITDDLIDALIEAWNSLPTEVKWANEALARDIRETLGVALFDDLTMTTREGMEEVKSSVTEPATELKGDLLDIFNSIPPEASQELNYLGQAIADYYGSYVTDAEDFAGIYNQTVLEAWNNLPQEARDKYAELGQAIAEEFGTIQTETGQEAQKVSQAATDPLIQAAHQVPSHFNAMGSGINSALQSIGNSVGSTMGDVQSVFNTGFADVSQYAIAELIEIKMAIDRLLSFMGISSGNGLPSGGNSGGRAPGAPQGQPVRGFAKGGVEVQGPTGGISDGESARVVYGEQERNVPESYIVWDRPDNEQLLYPTANAFGGAYFSSEQLDSLGIDGMARGGVRRGGRRRGGGRGGGGSAASPSIIGRTYNEVAAAYARPIRKDLKKKRKAKKREQARERRQNRRQNRASRKSESGYESGSGSGSDDTEPEESEESASDSGGSSPSTQAYPGECGGVYPVAEPTDPATQANTDAALTDSGLMAVQSNPSTTSADHVNAPAGIPGGDLCGASGGGDVSTPYPSIGSTPSGETPTSTSPWQSCGPSFAMAEGGTLGGSGSAEPLISAQTPLDQWTQFLGFSWYGDPGADWPEIAPPGGWDASTAWGDPLSAPKGSVSGYLRGGIEKNGVTYFQGGGLNAAQIQAGIDAGNSVSGSPYSYGSAGEDGGFDCAGIWNYIESAVAYGSPQTGKRWGTYDAAGGGGGQFTTPGTTPMGVNIGVDLGGWGGVDGTHMAGDIGGQSFESDIPSGVHAGYDSSAFGTQYTMGGSDYTSMLPSPGTNLPAYGDPSGTIGQEVADWWACQSAPYSGTASTSYPVNPWDSQLPGMTQDYLNTVGQGTLGSAGGVSPTPTGTTLRDWIVAALNASGLDASEENISTLETLANAESSGDPNAQGAAGELGLMQLMPDTWSTFGSGGDPYDPVANLIASIAYQMATYGGLVSFSPYAKGGFALQPHLGMVAEAGSREAMIPFDDGPVMSQFRHAIGTEGMSEGMEVLASKLDRLTQRVDYQTDVAPKRTGAAVAFGTDLRLAKSETTNRAVSKGRELAAMRDYNAGRNG